MVQNQKIKENDKAMQTALNNYKEFLKSSSDSYYKNQQGALKQTQTQQLTDLQKSYDQSVADNEKMKIDTNETFEDNVSAINDNAYLNSQRTDLSAQSRGIQNSQQLLAMQQGDQRQTQQLMDENRTTRDKRINEIKDRIARITKEYNSDVTQTNTNYNLGLQQARAQADMQYSQGMGEMNMAQYKQALEMKGQLTLQEQEQLNTLKRMETQQGYDLTKMSMQNQYTLGQMEQQQEYTQQNMAQQQQYDLTKMKTQYGYDMNKIDKQFDNDLAKMAKQYGYDMSKISAQQSAQMAQIKARQQAQIAQINAQKNAELEQLKNSWLSPSSDEYKIRKAQQEDASDQAIQQLLNQSRAEASAVLAQETGNMDKFISNPSQFMNNASYYSNRASSNPTNSTGMQGSGTSYKSTPNWEFRK